MLILALTSKTVPPSAIYDAADTVVAQRIAQVAGVADVTVSGAEQPAIRVRVNPGAIASAGISLEQVRTAIAGANAQSPLGVLDGSELSDTIGTNDQLRRAPDYKTLVVKSRQRQRRAALRHRDRGAGHAQQPLGRLVQPPALGAADHHQAGRRQRHRDGRPASAR